MLLFNDCQHRWHLYVIYGLCEELILGKHALYLQFDLISLSSVINYKNLMEWGTATLYKFPTGRRDKEAAEEAVLWKGDLYAASVGDSILDTWQKLRGLAENDAGLSRKATCSALC